MLNKISFRNFKVFKNWQTLELKPITILIGKNNSGKSAVLKLMTLIEGALKSNDPQPVNLINDDVVAGNEYEDLIYGKFGRTLGIRLHQANLINKKEDVLHVEIVVDINKNKPILDYWSLNDEIDLGHLNQNVYENKKEEEFFCTFEGLNLTNRKYKDKPDVEAITYKPTFNLTTDYIGSVRAETRPYYNLKNGKSNKSKIDGINLYNFLIEDFLSTDKKYFTQVTTWIKEKFEDWTLYIDADRDPYPIELRKGGLKINITETGMGIGQVLPLITRAFKPCSEETLIIIEEPESHLHPYAHAQLAQLFADSVKEDANKKYLFETHSQNFVLRMRRLIAEGKLDCNDLGIYYVEFDEDKNESNLKQIKVNNLGKVDFWPEDIFSETLEETIAIRTAQIDKENVGRTQ
jgi:predicted ATPase